jgi:hypothetical protein
MCPERVGQLHIRETQTISYRKKYAIFVLTFCIGLEGNLLAHLIEATGDTICQS